MFTQGNTLCVGYGGYNLKVNGEHVIAELVHRSHAGMNGKLSSDHVLLNAG